MNCNTCKHYDKSDYPFHCELANKDERFCNDCMHGIFHYEPKDEYAETEIDCAKIMADEYVKWSEEHKEELREPRINWLPTILCWLLLLFNFSLLTTDTYFIIRNINTEYKLSTAILIVSFVCLFYVTLKYFWQLAIPKRKY